MFKLWKRDRRSTTRTSNGTTGTIGGRRLRLALEPLEERTLLAAGALDPSFGDGGKVFTEFTGSQDNSARAVAVQADGKIVVGGTAETSRGEKAALARYNADGSLDTTFGTGGRVTTCETVLPACEFGVVQGLAVQADGKIIAAGTFTADVGEAQVSRSVVVRYHANGSLDPSFGTGGFAPAFGVAANDVLLQPDGKVVVVGAAAVRPPYSGTTFIAVARYNADGSFDASFATNGVVRSQLDPGVTAPRDSGLRGVLQPDGKILVAARANQSLRGSTVPRQLATLVRYNPDGTSDTGFGFGGAAVVTFEGVVSLVFSESATGLTLLTDGKIALVAEFKSTCLSCSKFGAPTFNHVGLATVHPNGSIAVRRNAGLLPASDGPHVAVDSRSQLLVTGLNQGNHVVRRFDFSGNSLGDTVVSGVSSLARPAIQGDGKVVLVGSAAGSFGNRDFILFRYQADLTQIDAGFGTAGRVTTDFQGSVPGEARSAVVQQDGKLIVAGRAGADFAIVRYLTNGSLDPSFGSGGRVMTDVDSTYNEAREVALQADGKILAVGSAGGRSVVTRYTADGSLDTSFGNGGKAYSFSGDGRPLRMLLQPDGRIVVFALSTGRSSEGFNTAFMRISRLNPNGTSDTLFSPSPGPSGFAIGVNQLADGRIVIAGGSAEGYGGSPTLLRLYANGNPDTSLGELGPVNLRSVVAVTLSALMLPDQRWLFLGRIITDTGTGASQGGLARFFANGNLDTTFGNGGAVRSDQVGNTIGNILLLGPDGRPVLVSGERDTFVVARLDPNGSLDSTFGSGGKVTTAIAGGIPLGGLVQADGKIVVVGNTSGPGTTRRTFVTVRYLGDDRAADANLRFVDQVFLDLLQRAPDPAGRAAFVNYLQQGGSRTLAAQAITSSPEYRSLIVRQFYAQVLNRNADPGGLNAFVSFLGAGGTVDQVRTALYSSPEYFQNRGGNANASFVAALFRDGMNRAIDPLGQQLFVQALTNSVPRPTVVNFVLQSAEAREGTVQTWYRRFLRRPADPGGLQAFVGALQAGMREEVALSAMIGSEEYLRRL